MPGGVGFGKDALDVWVGFTETGMLPAGIESGFCVVLLIIVGLGTSPTAGVCDIG